MQVPASAARGVHQVVVRGSSGRETRTLQLNLRVAEEVAGAFALTSEFPRLRGASDDTFQFDLTLTNSTAREASFNLLAEGPGGWEVKARPSTEQKATAATVEPDGEVTVQVEADPPDQVDAGGYPIVLRATGEGRSLEAKVVAEVVGSFDLAFSTADERLNASGPAGDTTSVALVIRNEGTAPLNRVTLSATPPTDWEVSFEPKAVDHVAPGDTARVAARIKPAGDAVAGDYDITLTASGEGASESLDLRYAVETSTLLGVTGAAVIVITVGTLLWVFRRFGRR